eukprot:3421519-Rhodomonas_salina.2
MVGLRAFATAPSSLARRTVPGVRPSMRRYGPCVVADSHAARAEMCSVQPLEATTPLQNNVRGKIVVIKRGTNTFFEKAQHAVNAGAAGVIYVNTDDNEPPAFTANVRYFYAKKL